MALMDDWGPLPAWVWLGAGGAILLAMMPGAIPRRNLKPGLKLRIRGRVAWRKRHGFPEYERKRLARHYRSVRSIRAEHGKSRRGGLQDYGFK
jgi:hypothetical protein